MKQVVKVLKFWFKSAVGLANLLCIVLLIASAYSGYVSPEKSVLFAYLGLGFPLICVLNVCFVLYWLFVLEWRWALAGIVSFLLCLSPMLNYMPLHKRVKAIPSENVLKILTYNVMGFGYQNHTESKPNPIVDYIAESGADIVCLQEYVVWNSKNHLTEEKLFKALKMYPYHSVLASDEKKNWGARIAVFSKYPITTSRRINYESEFNVSAIHVLNIKGKKMTLVNNHLESFKLSRKDKAFYSEILKKPNSESFGNFRQLIEPKLGPAFRIRARQADIIAGEIEKIKTDYLLVCGDFNDTPLSYVHHKILGNLTDAYATTGKGPGTTYNEPFLWFRIDHIFHSDNIQSYNCTIDRIRYSDHFPMWCYLHLK